MTAVARTSPTATTATTATDASTEAGLSYLEPDSLLTLREGLAEYYASRPDLALPREISGEVRDALRAHDAAHVVFGCDTSVRGEIVLTRWSVLGATDAVPIYLRGLVHPDGRGLFAEFFRRLRPRALVLGLIDGFRALWRSLHMRARWPSREWRRYLDRPLAEIREEFAIRVV